MARQKKQADQHRPTDWPVVRTLGRWSLAPLGVAMIALGVYLRTLAPTVTAEDSGELIAAAWHWGIPHPPGYPLWTLLCGTFLRLIGFGEIAWRANLFSAVCTAVAAGVLCAALRRLCGGTGAAAAAALCWALSRWCWAQAVIAEVYGLNSLLTATLLYCAVRWRTARSLRWLLAASLAFGLGMGNHHTIALSALALIAWIISQQPALLKRWRLILASVGLFCAGLLPYAYLPLRAAANPPMNWGDPSTAQRFIEHVTRHQYGAVGPIKAKEPRSLPRVGGQFAYLLRSVADDLTVPLAVAAIIGIARLARRDRSALALFGLWIITNAGLFVLLSNYDLDRVSRFALRVFLIPVTMGATVPLAYLFDSIVPIARRRTSGGDAAKREPAELARSLTLPARIGGAAPAILILLAPVWVAYSHWRQCDYSDYYYARDHADNLLACMLPGAMLFPSGDHNTFPLAYRVLVEGAGEDVVIADVYGYTRPDLYRDRPANSADSPQAWIIKRARRPAYYATKSAPPVPNARFVPAGLLYHLLPEGMDFDAAALLAKCSYRNHDPLRLTVADLGAAHINADFHFFSGLAALDNSDLESAAEHFAAAARHGAEIKELFNNMGSALAEHNQPELAESYFQEAARLDKHYGLPRWNLYRIAVGRQDWTLARQRLETLIACDPSDYRAYGQLGFLLHEQLNDSQGARAAWEKSLQLNPDQAQVRDALNRPQ